ncbi:GNAT family N-acetyltransferase [Liquorilactobacillus oeni]|nr:GNAT family N-acetyltransferase [Liquorilactobacillus oeni]
MKPKELITTKEFGMFYHLFCDVFEKNDTPDLRKIFFELHVHGTVLGFVQDEQLLSGLAWWRFKVVFQGCRYNMGAVGSVMTAPAARKKGNSTLLLQRALEQMAASGMTLSYLDPFSHAFYRRLGYGAAINHMHYTIAPEQIQLPRLADGLQEAAVSSSVQTGLLSEYLDKVASFYTQQLIHKSGGLLRPKWWWQHLCAERIEICCCLNTKQQLEGYFLYKRTRKSLILKELLVKNAGAEKSLLQFLHIQWRNIEQVIFESDEPVYRGQLLNEPLALSVQVKPFMMARIIDLQDFILRYPFKNINFGDFVLAVSDSQLAQNNGVWRLCTKNGRISFFKCALAPQEADINTSIAELVPLFFGQYSLEWAALHQRIVVKSLFKSVKLQAALLTAPVSFNDDF